MPGPFIDRLEHPAWLALAATLAGYAVVLMAMFVLLILVPFLVFRWF